MQVMWLGRSVSARHTPVVSTGSFGLYVALGIGGLPKMLVGGSDWKDHSMGKGAEKYARYKLADTCSISTHATSTTATTDQLEEEKGQIDLDYFFDCVMKNEATTDQIEKATRQMTLNSAFSNWKKDPALKLFVDQAQEKLEMLLE